MTSSKTPPKEIIEDFKALRQKRDRGNKLVVDIMSHPDATQEEILRARAICLNMSTQYKEIRASLREVYPNQSYWRIHPWNEREER